MHFVDKRRFSRRALLGGIAGGAVLAPFVPYLGSHAEAEGTPQRLFLVWTPNSSIHSMWKPSGTETSWTLGDVTRPLERHKEELIMISGLNKVPLRPDGTGSENNHCRGLGCTWTAEEFNAGTFRDSNGNLVGYNKGTSVDQLIAQRLAPPTPFRSIELGLMVGTPSPPRRMIYQGNDMPLSPETSPFRAFDRLFAGVTGGDTSEAERIRAERRSVIDIVRGSLTRVRAQAGVEDRARIDAHLDSVRAMETRLTDVSTATCSPPALGETTEHIPTLFELHADIITAAFACDLTRFGSLQIDHPASGVTWSWLGHTRFLHAIGHFDEPGARDAFIAADRWLHETMARVFDRFRDRGLFESSLVVWAQELSRSDAHFLGCVPFVLAGRCGGYFRTNRFLDYGGEPAERPSTGQPHSKLLTSICHAFGLTDVTHFGNPSWSGEGPLPRLAG